MFAVLGIFHLILRIYAYDNVDDDVRLYFYYGTSYDSDYQVYTLSDASAVLQNPYYRNTLPTALYIHGYKESTQVDSVRTVTNAYLTNDGFNTLVLDWGALAVGLYPLVVGRVAHVANRMVQVLLVLFAEGLPIRTFHLVGHSLGGQMAGAIGNGVRERSSQQITLERITALDPAGPLYYSLLHIIPILEKQISSTSARFVDVIHTDAGFFGQANACGHVDFWPNAGTRHQPGCDFIDSLLSLQNQLCSHTRSWMYWAESLIFIHSPNTFSAVRAANWYSFKNGHFDTSRVISMGLNCPKDAAGNWYLQTADKMPFSLDEQGIHYKYRDGLVQGILNTAEQTIKDFVSQVVWDDCI